MPQTAVINQLIIFLFIYFKLTFQTSIFHWVQIHRVHHKFSETVKDPLDVNRGFFFAHGKIYTWINIIKRGKQKVYIF